MSQKEKGEKDIRENEPKWRMKMRGKWAKKDKEKKQDNMKNEPKVRKISYKEIKISGKMS